MPRTRHELERDEKSEEILKAAERRLFDGGFEALSMVGIARELGVAQNAVYWYFPSRAALFVAVLRRVLEGIAARKSRGQTDVTGRILWWTDQFAPLYAFRPAMREQARTSSEVAEFVDELDGLLERMLTNVFSGRIADDDVAAAVESFRATVTGTYANGLSARRRRQVLTFTLRQLLRPSS